MGGKAPNGEETFLTAPQIEGMIVEGRKLNRAEESDRTKAASMFGGGQRNNDVVPTQPMTTELIKAKPQQDIDNPVNWTLDDLRNVDRYQSQGKIKTPVSVQSTPTAQQGLAAADTERKEVENMQASESNRQAFAGQLASVDDTEERRKFLRRL